MKCFYTVVFLFLSLRGNAQIGAPNFIDSSLASSGISKIVSADLDKNGYADIITSFSGTNGKLGYYLNQNGNFSGLHIVDTVPFSKGVATGDFNKDGWSDVVLIGDIDFSAFLYLNNSGSFSTPIVLDSQISITVNDIEVADFDGDGSDDIVIIGQHSIDYYRNNGSGIFNKEPVLTTSSSPKPLECMDLAKADFNADGYIDLVCAETAGLVVYINSGSGIFTPHYYSNLPEIGWLVHPFDVDADGDVDVVMRLSSGDIKWYDNDGTGTLNFTSQLSVAPTLHSFASIDYNNDGLEDLYASYLYHVSIFLNDSAHSFTTEISIVQDSLLYMDELCFTDINKDGVQDYVWSGSTRNLVYHLNLNSLSVSKVMPETDVILFPNPVSEKLFIRCADRRFAVEICDARGKILYKNERFTSLEAVDLSRFASGVYIVTIHTKGKKHLRKILVP